MIKTLAILLLACGLASPASIYTREYDNARTGANTAETVLTTANVGLLRPSGSFLTTGNIWWQPLYVEGVSILGTPTDVLLTATSQNNVYAFKAKLPNTSPIWSRNLGPACAVPQSPSYLFDNLNGTLGTAAIDPATNVMYFVACTGSYVEKLYAVNIADGTDFHAPVTIAATVGGNTFNAGGQSQRPGILLQGGVVTIAFGSYNDQFYGTATNWYGWILTYNSTTLAQLNAYVNSTTEASFWMAAGGVSTDGTSIFAVTANDNGDNTAGNHPETFLKFSSSLSVTDSLQPANWMTLDTNDNDLGTGRLIVDGSVLRGCSKDGRCWTLNKNALSTSPQSWQVATENAEAIYNGYVLGDGVFYVSPGACCGLEVISSFNCAPSSNCTTTPAAQSTGTYQFGSLTYTSNNGADGTKLLWVNSSITSADGNLGYVPGMLTVLDATTLQPLFQDRNVGNFAKFAPATIVNGTVYLPTNGGRIRVYNVGQTTGSPRFPFTDGFMPGPVK